MCAATKRAEIDAAGIDSTAGLARPNPGHGRICDQIKTEFMKSG
jgi:hypothetical protein